MSKTKKLYAIPASYPPHKIIINDQCFEKFGGDGLWYSGRYGSLPAAMK